MNVATRSATPEPIKLLLLALGGEGGGVLADWIVDTARAQGLPVQATSVPGVAQRTGATSYYLELLPAPMVDREGRAPVFCLSPTSGDLDLVVSSELLETARALERGLLDETRTVLISSTGRALTVAEKMQQADGRFDLGRIERAAQALSREAVLFDMQAEARAAGTVISSVLFGAIAASGLLPLPRAACEATIRGSGRGVAQSLAGFSRGFDGFVRARVARSALGTGTGTGTGAGGGAGAGAGAGQRARGEEPLDTLVALGRARLADYLDEAYAELYVSRIARIAQAERHAGSAGLLATGTTDSSVGPPADDLPATRAAARFLALWMGYEDVVRVADLKTRPQRFERIRADMHAQDHEPVVVREYLKPRAEEIAAVLPPLAARLLRGVAARRAGHGSDGIRLSTTSLHGLAALRLLAALRPLRRRSTRFALEQARIERWMAALLSALPAGPRSLGAAAADTALALEIARLPRLLKGYGDTWARGERAFDAIVQALAEPPLRAGETPAERAAAIAEAHRAALADPQGRALAQRLGQPAPEPKPQPVRFVARAASRGAGR